MLDCGAVQADALTVDRLASLEKVWCKFQSWLAISEPFFQKKKKKIINVIVNENWSFPCPYLTLVLFPFILIFYHLICWLCYHNFSCVGWLFFTGSFSVIKYSQMSVLPRTSVLATEVEWLNSIKADLVVLTLNDSFLDFLFMRLKCEIRNQSDIISSSSSSFLVCAYNYFLKKFHLIFLSIWMVFSHATFL